VIPRTALYGFRRKHRELSNRDVRPSAHCAVWRIGNEKWDTALEWFSRQQVPGE
jgi:hypothetical protein